MTDQQAQEYGKIAYYEAYRILNNIEDARDISQSVILNLLTKNIEVKDTGYYSYIKKIARNNALDYKDNRKQMVTFHSMEHLITEDLLQYDEPAADEKRKIIQKNMRKLSYFERDLLHNYFKNGCRIKKLSLKRKEKYKTLKKKINNLKRDIMAEYYSYSGMIGSQKIINSKLNRNIKNFMKTFRRSLETNTLHKMRIYFGTQLNNEQIPRFDVSRIHNYNIRLAGKNKYRLIVYYFDSNKDVNCYFLFFRTYYRNRIRIIELPKYPRRITGFDTKKLPAHIKKQLEPNKKGVVAISKEKKNELLKDYSPVYERSY